jgi:hypothetical protein
MKAFAVLFLSIVSLALSAQGGFIQLYSNTAYDRTSREVLPTADGGYLIAGATNNNRLNDCDVYIMKTDGGGIFQWEKIFGGNSPDYAYSMIQSEDGNYLVTGFSQSFGGGDADVYLLKIDPSGNKIYEKTIGGTGNEEAREIIRSSDGNYLIIGSSNSSLGSQDMCVWKVKSDGTLLSRWNFGGGQIEFGNSIKEFEGGGYIAVGQTFSSGAGKGDVYIVKINADGTEAWTKTYGGAQDDEAISVVVNSDNSFVMAVRDSSQGHDVDVRILKYDGSGTVTSDKLFSGTEKDTPKRIRKTADGGYIVGTISRSFGWIYPDMWIIKLDANCDSMWTRHYGWGNHEHCHDVKQLSDGNYVAVGHSRSAGPAQEIMFVKMGSTGVVNVPELAAAPAEPDLYPNPSEGAFNLTGAVNGISVYDLSGKKVFEDASHLTRVDLSGTIKPGIYLLNIRGESGILPRKLVVR